MNTPSGTPRTPESLRSVRKSEPHQKAICFNLTEDRLDVAWFGGSSNQRWNSMPRWLEGPDLFLLYATSLAFYTLPKRSLTRDQQSETRGLLTRAIGPEGKSRKVNASAEGI